MCIRIFKRLSKLEKEVAELKAIIGTGTIVLNPASVVVNAQPDEKLQNAVDDIVTDVLPTMASDIEILKKAVDDLVTDVIPIEAMNTAAIEDAVDDIVTEVIPTEAMNTAAIEDAVDDIVTDVLPSEIK